MYQPTQSVVKGAPLDIRVRISMVSPLLEASSSLLPKSTKDMGTVALFGRTALLVTFADTTTVTKEIITVNTSQYHILSGIGGQFLVCLIVCDIVNILLVKKLA